MPEILTAPSPLTALLALERDQRRAILEQTHPAYDAHRDEWRVLLDAYDGVGGFLDGAYLWRYPNEEPADFRDRQQQARYHNVARAVIDLYVRHILGQTVTRQTTDPELEAWWRNVDGSGLPIDGVMRRAAAIALVAGHVGLLVDKPPVPARGPTRAEDRTPPFVTLYPPLAIRDWRLDRGTLVALKLADQVPQHNLLDALDPTAVQYTLWDRALWVRLSAEGELLGLAEHATGQVPFVWIAPIKAVIDPLIGRSIVGSANTFRALYNRHSEEDSVLRAQSFSMLVLTVPDAASVEREQQLMSRDVGATRALITSAQATYLTPDQQVPIAIRQSAQALVREVYRAAHVRFERDSLEAESAEALRLQFAELNEALEGVAAELQAAETRLAQLYYAWTQPTPAAAEAAFARANVQIRYPSEFFARDLQADLEALAQALALDLGPTFAATMKKRLARQLDPELDAATQARIDAEIEAGTPTSGPRSPDDLIARTASRLSALAGE